MPGVSSPVFTRSILKFRRLHNALILSLCSFCWCLAPYITNCLHYWPFPLHLYCPLSASLALPFVKTYHGFERSLIVVSSPFLMRRTFPPSFSMPDGASSPQRFLHPIDNSNPLLPGRSLRRFFSVHCPSANLSLSLFTVKSSANRKQRSLSLPQTPTPNST